ncbi:MAG: ATP-binding protein [Bacteroidales bacterium]|nr:ATP-binding protein [Bacteroidales bacterium]
MKKNEQNFNAIQALTHIARLLDNSGYDLFRLHNPELPEISNINNANRLRMAPDSKPVLTEDEKAQVKTEIEFLGKFFKTTPIETLLLVAIYSIQSNSSGSADTRDICRFLDLEGLDFLPFKKSLLNLPQKRLTRVTNHRRSDDYVITDTVEQALLHNKPLRKMKPLEISRFQFCEVISNFIEDRSRDDIDTEELFSLVEREENVNTHLKFIKELKKILPDAEERTLFYEICDDFLRSRRHQNTDLEVTLRDIYDDLNASYYVARSIMNKNHPMLQKELVELLPAKFLAEAELCLTEKGKKLLLEDDYDLFCGKGNSDKRLVTPEKIPARELFFSTELTENINFVKESLMEDAFVELQKRLEENSLPKGVAILMHGSPGTGKTATAEMIAKATGRSVYHVDIAASKSCWFGESEKLFKKIFTDYNRMCETEERKPILLFNEADALFSKRRDVDNGGSCTQTENSLQNILLEEMEKLDGILIATTNLCTNFDDAFERRFLFKIKFTKPTTEAKKAIWKNKMSWLSDEDCENLANRYDLTGGEIDNIVRKSVMENVLTGKQPTMEMLCSWCRGENLERKGGNAIGFSHN